MYTRGLRFCAIVLYSHIDLNALADGARTTIDTSSRFDGTESKSAGVLILPAIYQFVEIYASILRMHVIHKNVL